MINDLGSSSEAPLRMAVSKVSRKVSSISCTPSRETNSTRAGLVVLDEDDDVIRPAILWNDGRTQKETDYLNNEIGKDKLSEYTANIAFAGFTAPKILWMRENEPDNFNKIKKIMLPKDYLAYKLSGTFRCV